MDAHREFREAIRDYGLEPPDHIVPGRFHRFPGRDKGSSNRAGWCFLYEDERGGCFGDWSTGESVNWFADKRGQTRSVNDYQIAYRKQGAALDYVNAVRDEEYEAAANRAEAIWQAARPAPKDHPYLHAKGIKPARVRCHQDALVLPVLNFDRQLTSLQFIGPTGQKRLLAGGRKQQCFIPVSSLETLYPVAEPGDDGNFAYCAYSAHRAVGGKSSGRCHCAYSANCAYRAPTVVVCEGWATGCTLAQNHPGAVVLAAIDAGNLPYVAIQVRRRWPTVNLIIAGDDDRLTPGNPGATKARQAADISEGLLALPNWPEDAPEDLTDFNDLDRWLAEGEA